MGQRLRVGEILRYPSVKDPSTPMLGDYRNFFHVTDSPGSRRALLEAGINGIAKVPTSSGAGARRPALLVRSSPWKAGSEQTPWHDVFDMDNGHVRYFGDHKAGSNKPVGTTLGNASLLEAFDAHQAPTREGRLVAPPLLLFWSVSRNNKPKGHVEFCGVGLIERAERIVQWSGHDRSTFTNYVYDLAVLDLATEEDTLDWDWVSARRDSCRSDEEVLAAAPGAWQAWVEQGNSALPRLRRQVARSKVVKVAEQRTMSHRERADLETVYRRFDHDKHAFEGVASAVAARVLCGSGNAYREGWLTRRSGDGGADFVGRLDLGTAAVGTGLVVLGQAKCVKPDTTVSAEQIARVVARLKRGWIGVYVTTGAFSVAAQLEMIEDQYPVVLVNGVALARELRAMAVEDHAGDLPACIEHLVANASTEVTNRRPEEILLL